MVQLPQTELDAAEVLTLCKSVQHEALRFCNEGKQRLRECVQAEADLLHLEAWGDNQRIDVEPLAVLRRALRQARAIIENPSATNDGIDPLKTGNNPMLWQIELLSLVDDALIATRPAIDAIQRRAAIAKVTPESLVGSTLDLEHAKAIALWEGGPAQPGAPSHDELIHGMGDVPPDGGGIVPASHSIEVSVEKLEAVVNVPGKTSKTFQISRAQSARFLKVLADNPRVWISGPDLRSYDKELDGARTDKLRKGLPQEIQCLVETSKQNGARLNMEQTLAHEGRTKG